MSTAPTGGADRAWGWVAHLRAGGTTSWARWEDTGQPSGHLLPGAQQLELLRRLNQAGRPSPKLAERVLVASGQGRGATDLELVGAAPARAFGTPAVNPGELSHRELLRVAATLLAEDVAPIHPVPPPEAFPRPWRVRHHLVGDPLRAHDLRVDLMRQGRAGGGPGPLMFVLAAPVDHLLADTWTRRCFEDGVERWPDFVRAWRKHDRLPPRVDLAEVARRAAARHGHHRVRIVIDQRQLSELLHVRRLPAPERPAAETAEMGRRIASALGLMVPPERRKDLMRWVVWPRIPRRPSAPVGVPEAHRDWLGDVARRMARELRRDGYPVVGDLDDLAPTLDDGTVRASGLADRVFDLALQMLLDDGWAEVPR